MHEDLKGKTACINVMMDPTVISPGSVALANLGGYRAGQQECDDCGGRRMFDRAAVPLILYRHAGF